MRIYKERSRAIWDVLRMYDIIYIETEGAKASLVGWWPSLVARSVLSGPSVNIRIVGTKRASYSTAVAVCWARASCCCLSIIGGRVPSDLPSGFRGWVPAQGWVKPITMLQPLDTSSTSWSSVLVGHSASCWICLFASRVGVYTARERNKG